MKRSIWTLIMGILMIGAGVLALIHPFPASLAGVVFAAWSFMILGVLQLISAFRDAQGGNRIWLILGCWWLISAIRPVTRPVIFPVQFISIIPIWCGWSRPQWGCYRPKRG